MVDPTAEAKIVKVLQDWKVNANQVDTIADEILKALEPKAPEQGTHAGNPGTYRW